MKFFYLGSEDFGEYTDIGPGCYFYMGNGKDNNFNIHADNYNFNDDLIPLATLMWIKIAELSLDITLIGNWIKLNLFILYIIIYKYI